MSPLRDRPIREPEPSRDIEKGKGVEKGKAHEPATHILRGFERDTGVTGRKPPTRKAREVKGAEKKVAERTPSPVRAKEESKELEPLAGAEKKDAFQLALQEKLARRKSTGTIREAPQKEKVVMEKPTDIDVQPRKKYPIEKEKPLGRGVTFEAKKGTWGAETEEFTYDPTRDRKAKEELYKELKEREGKSKFHPEK